jgi:hypothetical protein
VSVLPVPPTYRGQKHENRGLKMSLFVHFWHPQKTPFFENPQESPWKINLEGQNQVEKGVKNDVF